MKKLTRSNIAHDLTITPHILEETYPDGTIITFYFSSDFYRNNFIQRKYEHRKTINLSLSNRFGFEIIHEKLADLKLYTMIEKRGFLLDVNGKAVECPDNLILDGTTLILRS